MSRQRLPDRRRNEIVDFEHDGQRYTAAISRFPGGAVGEIFLTSKKYGSAVHLHAQDSAILASLALQHGVTAGELRSTIAGPISRALAMFPERGGTG